jgi:hypothetical protein
MTTLNDYLSAGKKALDQRLPLRNDTTNSRRPLPNRPQPQREPRGSDRGDEWPPKLGDLLQRSRDLPPYSTLLGVGEDGLAFHVDLTNPATGAVLACGDAHADLTGLIRSILASAIALNTPDQVSVSVVARNVEAFMDFTETDHIQEIFPADDTIVGEFLIELAEIVEARRSGKKPEPAILLFIDDLAECVEFLGEQAYARLYWLIRHGPRHQVWTFASLPAERGRMVGERFLSAFRTRLIGHIRDQRLAAELSQDPGMRSHSLQPAELFLPYGSEWFRFWICPLDETGHEYED